MANAAQTFPCDECGKGNTDKAQRVDPRNLAVTYRRLCKICQRKLGFAAVTYGHGSPSHINAAGERV